MDPQAWEQTVIQWVNALTNGKPISSCNELKSCNVFNSIIKSSNSDPELGIIQFINKLFPNYFLDTPMLVSDFDYLCAASLFLIAISFSSNPEYQAIKNSMCKNLSNVHQQHIADFLMSFQNRGEPFKTTIDILKEEIYKFVQNHAIPLNMMGDCAASTTPQRRKNSNSSLYDSPLMEFFQTPKRNRRDEITQLCVSCSDVDKTRQLKFLSDQLNDEELEKIALQDKLTAQKKLCSEYENKLKDKMAEIKQLKNEWEDEVHNADEKLKSLTERMEQKLKNESVLKKEVSYFENVVLSMEKEVSNICAQKADIEMQWKAAVSRCVESEKEVQQAVSVQEDLRAIIESKEMELLALGRQINSRDINESLDISIFERSMGENLGEVLMNDLRSENHNMKDEIAELHLERDRLKSASETQLLQITTLQNLNSELEKKLESFEETTEELEQVKSKLYAVTEEFEKVSVLKIALEEENSNLTYTLTSRESELSSREASNEALKTDFVKISQDFQTAQRSLDEEMKNVARLAQESEEKHLQLTKCMKTLSKVSSELDHSQKSLDKVSGLLTHDLQKMGDLLGMSVKKESNESFTSCQSVEEQLEKLSSLLVLLEVKDVESSECMETLEKQCVQLNETVNTMQVTINRLEEKEQATLKEKGTLHMTVEEAEKKIAALQSSIEMLSAKVKSLENDINEKNQQITKLNESLEISKVNADALLSEKEGLMTELGTLQNNFTKAQLNAERLERLQTTNEKNLLQQMRAKGDELEVLKTKIKTLEDETRDLNEQLRVKEYNLTQLEIKVDAFKKSHTAQMIQKSSQINALQNEFAKLQTCSKGFEARVRDLESELNHTRGEKEDLMDSLSITLDDYKVRFADKTEKLDKFKLTISDLQQQCNHLQDEKSQLICDLQTSEQKIEELKEKHKIERKLLDTENKSLATLNDSLQDLRLRLLAVEVEKEQTFTKIVALEKDLKIQQTEKFELEETYNLKMINLNARISELSNAESQLSELKSGYNELIEIHKSTQSDLQEMANHKMALEDQIRNHEEEKLKMENELELSGKAFLDLQRKCVTLDKQSSDTAAYLLKQRTEIADLNLKMKILLEKCDTIDSRETLKPTTEESVEETMNEVGAGDFNEQIMVNERLIQKSKTNLAAIELLLESICDKLKREVGTRLEVEHLLVKETESVKDLNEELHGLKNHHEKVMNLSHKIKSNVSTLKSFCQLPKDAELHIIYDQSKALYHSLSQMSMIPEISIEKLNSVSSTDVPCAHTSWNVPIDMEDLNHDIIEAKRSLIDFLQASMKQFEVLKIKENMINSMTEQQMSLEQRVTVLSELNEKLKTGILQTETMSKIDAHSKEQQLETLKEDVLSLKASCRVLKEKLMDLEKANGVLDSKKEESLLEINRLREKNKTMASDLQNRVMSQLRQQDMCWGLIRSKQETDLELEKLMKSKNDSEKRIAALKPILATHKNKTELNQSLFAVEQKLFLASQRLLYTAYSCLRWTQSNIEHQCLLMTDDRIVEENDSRRVSLESERAMITDQLTSIAKTMHAVAEDLEVLKLKTEMMTTDVLSDSLEEVPIANKTFDIINLDRLDTTYSIRTESSSLPKNTAPTHKMPMNDKTSWVVSPPKKGAPKEIEKKMERKVQGETWVVPLDPPKKIENKNKTKSQSAQDVPVLMKEVAPIREAEETSVSASFCSVSDVEYSPPSKRDSLVDIKRDVSRAEAKKEVEGEATAAQTDKTELIVNRLPETTPHELAPLAPIAPSAPATDKANQTFYINSEEPSELESRGNLKDVDFQLKTTCEKDQPRIPDESKVENESFMQCQKSLEVLTIEGLSQQLSETVKKNEQLVTALKKMDKNLKDLEIRRVEEKNTYEKNQAHIRRSITEKYETQLEHLKSEMKSLYNRELAKHKTEQQRVNKGLCDQNKTYKEHIDDLRNQLWEVGEKLLNEQKLRRDLERIVSELKKKQERMMPKETIGGINYSNNIFVQPQEPIHEEPTRIYGSRRTMNNMQFPTIPTEDEDEVFDNRCLEDMKSGRCRVEGGAEGRLTELQFRNSMCLPHLKSSYPAETQFHPPQLYQEDELRRSTLHFAQESQSLTDSDHSMTRSLLPEDRGRKKEQTSYKRPGPPTPSKNGGRLSLQSGELHFTPKSVLKDNNEENRLKGTPNRLKALFQKSSKRDSIGSRDENSAPSTPRGKKLPKLFRQRKPFGGRD